MTGQTISRLIGACLAVELVLLYARAAAELYDNWTMVDTDS